MEDPEMAKSSDRHAQKSQTASSNDEDWLAHLKEAYQPIGYLTDQQGEKTAVILPIETYNLMLLFHHAMALRIEQWNDEVLSQEELAKLFADYGLVFH